MTATCFTPSGVAIGNAGGCRPFGACRRRRFCLKIGVPGGTRTQNDSSAFVRLDRVRKVPKRRVAKDLLPAHLVPVNVGA
jgi:hypothetical protein